MAFLGRGNGPSIRNSSSNNSGSFHRIPFFYRRYYYIPLDNTYILLQMIVTFIILIVGVVTFLVTYKSDIIDPIESTKKIFINAHLIVIAIFLIFTIIINLFSKKEANLARRLILLALISISTMLLFLGVKLDLDTTYTKAKFEEIFIEANATEVIDGKTKIDVGLSGISIKTEQEHYMDECMKLYNIFKVKSFGTLGIHLLLNILLVYQILKIKKIQTKKKRLNKDDLILYDKEQNIKI